MKFCEAERVKMFFRIRSILIAALLILFFLSPSINVTYSQGNGSSCDPNAPVCDPGLSCVDPYGEGTRYECRGVADTPEGASCDTSKTECKGDLTCSPNAPGDTQGTCKKLEEGIFCNRNNIDSCGARTTSPLYCQPDAAKGGDTCQRRQCDPVNKHAECKAEGKSLFCIPDPDGKTYCKFSTISPDDWCDRLEVGTPCYQEDPNRPTKWCVADPGGGQPTCKVLKNPPPLPTAPNSPCAKGQFDAATGRCKAFSSGFGNFATDASEFLRNVFGILLAFSGAIALLLIIRAGYKIMTSQGNQDAIKEGREQLIAAIVGLLFLIFAFVFLEVIGVDLLRIPGFGGVSTAPPAKLQKGADCLVGNNQCGSGLICRDTKQPTQINNNPGKCLDP